MSDIIIIFGSSVVCSTPHDIDVAYTGTWGEADDALVREWAAGRGLDAALPVDNHKVTCWTGEITLPRCRDDETPPVAFLRGQVPIRWITYHDLPSRVRGAQSARELAMVLYAPNFLANRLALVARAPTGTDHEWSGYTQGLTALRSAIAKCAFWHASIDACAKIDRLLARGIAPSMKKKLRGGASAGSPDVNCIVTARGLESIHGRVVVPFPHPWARKRTLTVAR